LQKLVFTRLWCEKTQFFSEYIVKNKVLFTEDFENPVVFSKTPYSLAIFSKFEKAGFFQPHPIYDPTFLDARDCLTSSMGKQNYFISYEAKSSALFCKFFYVL